MNQNDIVIVLDKMKELERQLSEAMERVAEQCRMFMDAFNDMMNGALASMKPDESRQRFAHRTRRDRTAYKAVKACRGRVYTRKVWNGRHAKRQEPRGASLYERAD